jgi:hypothetical protein
MATTVAITGPGGRALEVEVAGPDDARVVLSLAKYGDVLDDLVAA